MNETILEQVHKWIEVTRNGQPANFDEKQLYAKLIVEESSELFQAIIQGDDLAQIDGCVDTLWVLLGFIAVTEGTRLREPNNLYIDHIWDTRKLSEHETFEYLVIAMNMKYGNFIEQYFENGMFLTNSCIDYIVCITSYMQFKGWDAKGAWAELVKSNNTKLIDGVRVKRNKNGKIEKPAHYYKSPQFESFLNRQGV